MTTAIIILSVVCICAAAFAIYLSIRISTLKADRAIVAERASSLENTLEKAETTTEDLTCKLTKSEEILRQKSESLIKAESEVSRLKLLLEAEIKRGETERAAIKEHQQELAKQTEANFKVMANEILQRQSASLREQNETRIGEILTPLKEDIDKFRRDVTECYSTEARERFSLQEKIKELIEANNTIGREAKELSTALRGNSKKQGDWGELVLENILEQSGLRKGHEFTVQQQTTESGEALRDESGRGLRPDVIVHCPDGRAMVIDSKVSLTAFIDYVNAEDPEQQQHYGKLHLASVVKHINELSDKKYQDYVGNDKLDFVMMFIPNEGAYSAALSLDPTIWQKAYDKRVLIVSPTQLVGSLRLINQLWNHDRQTRNAIEIAEKSGQMYDKFVGFIADMERIEKSITAARSAYDGAMNKLRDGRGNLISRAESLRQLGIKATKRLKSIESDNDVSQIPDA